MLEILVGAPYIDLRRRLQSSNQPSFTTFNSTCWDKGVDKSRGRLVQTHQKCRLLGLQNTVPKQETQPENFIEAFLVPSHQFPKL